MFRIRTAIVAFFAFAAVAVVVPSAVMGAHHNAGPSGRVFGLLESINANGAPGTSTSSGSQLA
jgi:hypothetical protein